MAAKLMSVDEAVGIIPDGATVACAGFVGAGHPEALTAAIEERFLADGRPADLTLVFSAGQGDGEGRGLDHLAHEGLLKRVIGGHFGLTPQLGKLIVEGKVEAYNWPAGVISHLYRAIAAGQPGVVTAIGLKTFVDPRRGGGKLNNRLAPDLVEVVKLRGREWLLYPSLQINVALVRGTTADEQGNLTMENEAHFGDALALAQAARNSGGVVLAQVERVAARGTLDPRLVRVPGILVDGVVIAPPELHPQTFAPGFDPSYCGAVKAPLPAPPTYRLRAHKIIARRVAMELSAGMVINVGADMTDHLTMVLHEEGIADHVTIALQSGTVGGVPAGGLAYGAAANPDAILDQPAQYDFLDGGGLDVAVLGATKVDARGNVNASRFGSLILGCGAFINLSQSARQVLFCASFTDGAEIALLDGALTVMREGEERTFVSALEQITFAGRYATEHGRRVLYITERAVFELRAGKLTLTEIAPGVDFRRHLLPHMDFRPEIDSDLKRMDATLFSREPMGLSTRF
jgi:propionate CoA-transferase